MKILDTLLCSTALTAMCAVTTVFAASDWVTAGNDLQNSRNQTKETRISPKSVGALTLKWAVSTDGDVTANPAVDDKYVYFPDSAGSLYKVDRKTGVVTWKRPISNYTGIAGDFARGTPAIVGDALILGNQSGKFLGTNFGQPDPKPAQVFAVNKVTGALIWSTQVDDTVMSYVTHSPIVSGKVAYVGTASNEELVAGFVPQAYGWEFHFRGSVVALDISTGAIKWRTFMVPEGHFGGAIWGSTGAIDTERRQLYMATGNNYAVPQSDLDCLNGGGTPVGCMSPDNHFDSIVALDMDTGAFKWAGRGLSYDAWNVGCGLSIPGVFTLPPNDNCPNPKGPDWDFAQGPILLTDPSGKGGKLVGAGQKSGMFWTFDAKDGHLVWSTQVTPGGLTGGLQWGSATDGGRIFVAASNSGPTGSAQAPENWVLRDGTTTKAGGWAALDRKTGNVIWTTKDPQGSRAEGAVSVANGVVFGCSMAGSMYAMNATDGAILWSYESGGACNAGPSVADGVVYWGSGTFNGTGAKKVFAFGL